MIGRVGMGRNTSSCTRSCVARGATYGFVDRKGRLYQLDDQAKPAPFAGKRVRLLGRIEGDTIYVEKIEPRRRPGASARAKAPREEAGLARA